MDITNNNLSLSVMANACESNFLESVYIDTEDKRATTCQLEPNARKKKGLVASFRFNIVTIVFISFLYFRYTIAYMLSFFPFKKEYWWKTYLQN